jgi:hypothetical protein
MCSFWRLPTQIWRDRETLGSYRRCWLPGGYISTEANNLLIPCYASFKVSCYALRTIKFRLKTSRLCLKTSRLPLPIPYFLTSNEGENHPKTTTSHHPRELDDIFQCVHASFVSHTSFPTTIVQREENDM